jgi:LysR family glycine cleavage system transcriptional activator
LAGLSEPIQTQHLQFEQMYFALQAAAEGLGLVLVPLFLVADDIIAGRLCAPFGMTAARKRQYFANALLNPTPDPVVDTFYEWLLKEGRDTEQSIDLLASSMGWRP